MAKEKENKTKYKFGERELDMKYYLDNADHNVLAYIDDRRRREGWTDDMVLEFTNSYNNQMQALRDQLTNNSGRFYTDATGTIHDSQGQFSNTDNDNIDPNGSQYYYDNKGNRITTDDYNLLKDKKKAKYKTFQANQQVARYLNTIGRALKPEEKPATNKFDNNKHGFVNWWKNAYNIQGNSADLKPYLDLDPYNEETGKRATTKRGKQAQDWIGEYLDWLGKLDIDFSDNQNFQDYESFAAFGKQLGEKWADGNWEPDDLISANRFGIGSDWLNSYFTTEENPNVTSEEIAANKAKKEEEERKAKEAEILAGKKAFIKSYDDMFKNAGYTHTFDSPYSGGFINKWFDKDGNIDYEKLGNSYTTEGLTEDDYQKYFDDFVQDIYNGQKYNPLTFSRNIAMMIHHGFATPITSGKFNGMYYIPNQADLQRGSGMVYDPTSGHIFNVGISYIPSEWKKITDKYDEEHGLVKDDDDVRLWKTGGKVDSLQVGGNIGQKIINDRDAYIENKAEEAGQTVEKYKATHRKPGGDKTLLEQENGWSKNDILRLTAIGTDLAAMGLSFTPAVGASALTGAAGTTQHLIADVAEDGFDWGDVGRAALGYSMDALGVLPGFAAVSKPMKIAKTLARYAPRLIATVGAVGTVANAPAIIKSLNKLTTDEHLTVQDWQNVTSALTLAIGGTAAAGRKYHTVTGSGKALKGPNTETGDFVIQVRNKSNNKIENLRVTKDEAKAIQNSKSNEDVLNALKNRPGMDNYELVTSTSWLPHVQFRENGKWNPSIGFRQKAALLMPLKRDQRTGRIYAENGKWGADIDKSQIHGITEGQAAVIRRTRTEDSAISKLPEVRKAVQASERHALKLKDKDTKIQNYERQRTAAQARIDAVAKPARADNSKTIQAELDALIAQRKGTGTSTNFNLNKVKVRRASSAADIAKGEKAVARLEKQLQNLQATLATTRGKRNRAAVQSLIDNTERRLTVAQQSLDNRKAQHTHDEDWWSKYGNSKGDAIKKKLTQQLSEATAYESAIAGDKHKISQYDKALTALRNLTNTKGQTTAFRKLSEKRDPDNADNIIFDIAGPGGTTLKVTRNWTETLKKYGIKYQRGGKFEDILKFQEGGRAKIRNVASKADWYKDMFSSQEMQTWLKDFNKTNYGKFNDLLRSWSKNYKDTGFNYENPEYAYGGINGPSQEVLSRQGIWQELGLNAPIGRLRDTQTIIGNGGSNDKADTYQDGWFGSQEFLRHGGSEISWRNVDPELLQQAKQLFESQGLDYYLDNESQMYLLRPLSQRPSETPVETSETPEVTTSGSTSRSASNQESLNTPAGEPGKSTGSNGAEPIVSSPDKWSKLFNDPKWLSLGRVAYANAINDRMTERSLQSPLVLMDPIHYNMHISTGEAELAGLAAAALVQHLANQPLTSDARVQLAAMLEGTLKGQEYINLGKTADRTKLYEDIEKLRQLRKAEKDFNYTVAMDNRTRIGNKIDNNINIKNARDAKEYSNIDTFLQELQYDWKQNKNRTDALTEKYALLKIQNDAYDDIKGALGNKVTDDEIKAWEKGRWSNQSPSVVFEGDEAGYNNYVSAYRKLQQYILNRVADYYGIHTNPYGNIRALALNLEFVPKPNDLSWYFLKNGGTVKAAKIREHSRNKRSDADRFYKTTKDKLDRIEKAIDRLDKKMYKRREPLKAGK